ncbi:MAG: SSU ribosomal protein S15p (S13e), partial [uncultured Solirubrobacteraceae bacterium]
DHALTSTHAGDRHAVRRKSAGHREHPGPDRPPDAAHQRPDAAPPLAQEGPPLPSWPAHARRSAPPPPELPREVRPRGVPRADQAARPAQV